jgi:phosphohistidine phosphatase
MKQLLLYRHAKSSWDASGIADRERPLSSRGRRDAAVIARQIGEGYPVDRILCSPARRTLETLAALLPSLRGEATITVTEKLYEPVSGDYRPFVASQGDGADCLLIVGHNPAIQATALALIGTGDEADMAKLAAKYPTGAVAAIAFDDADWADIQAHGGRLMAFHRPRDFDEHG